MDENELAVSFNIVLDDQIQSALINLQRKLSAIINDKRTYDSSPHLAICTKFMPERQVSSYSSLIKSHFQNLPQFKIGFTKFEPSTTKNFIFLNLDAGSREFIFSLNKRILLFSKNLGNETLHGLPAKYPYDPHISIIKLELVQIPLALKELTGMFDFNDMLVTKLELTVEKKNRDNFSTFPQRFLINLKIGK